ncbi:hypothetical protein [Jeotgalicoccus sp. S0W5]|uniref:hypothetical protein n=1 Tax=Jeotgalicoccus sp. S0W5 TaxID=2527874 RepID=UPI0014151932|nr:hypothetical protein [Jeotgalicoccus sp. S0W5]
MKKLLVIATLSIAVAAVIKRVTEKKKTAQIKLNLGNGDYKTFTKGFVDPNQQDDIHNFAKAIRSNISNFKTLANDSLKKSEQLDESLNELSDFVKKMTK